VGANFEAPHALSGVSDQTTSRGPSQQKLFCDSVIWDTV